MKSERFTFDFEFEDSIIPVIESITGLKGQDAVEHFCTACIMNNVDTQQVLNTLRSDYEN
jgi:hypothetical protein